VTWLYSSTIFTAWSTLVLIALNAQPVVVSGACARAGCLRAGARFHPACQRRVQFVRKCEQYAAFSGERLAVRGAGECGVLFTFPDKLNPSLATLDENVRLLEDTLHVRTHLNDNRLSIEGDQDSVGPCGENRRGVQPTSRRHGRKLTSAEVKSLIHVAHDEPPNRLAVMFEHGRQRSFGKKVVTPKNASQRRLHGRD